LSSRGKEVVKKYLAMMPPHLGRALFGVWLIGMALTDTHAWVHIGFNGYQTLLAVILIASGVLTLFGR
jgi:hypothetical protein